MDIELIENQLFQSYNYIIAGNLLPSKMNYTGLYSIKLIENSQLPYRYQKILNNRTHRLLYIGKAQDQPLNKRLLNQELRGKGKGTFFRSLGAMLGYRPPEGSLLGKKNQYNFIFSEADKSNIVEWINRNLLISYIEYDKDFSIEILLIRKYRPLLNMDYNPIRLKELDDDRTACREIALYKMI